MPTCKENCLCYSVCTKFEAYARNPKLNLPNPSECIFFKDRSKFIELPCKVGDIVYYFDASGRIYKQTVSCIIYGGTGLLLDSDVMFDSKFIGSKFFLTYKEAEKALKEQSNG